MNNVREFPYDRNIRKQLETLRDKLNEIQDALGRGYALIDTLEKNHDEHQDAFDDILEMYANAVGFENVEVGFIEYASRNVTVEQVGDELIFKLEAGSPETEIVFTPWEENNDDTT